MGEQSRAHRRCEMRADSHREGEPMNHREFFDRAAASWDVLESAETVVRLREVLARVGVEEGMRVVDVGTGTGILVPLLLEQVGPKDRIVALDISPRMLEAARAKGFPANVEFVEADAARIPLPAASFDLVVCNATFPHFPDKARALAEMARVLKPGAKLAICHTSSREQVNRLHKEIGGAVAGDEIPEEPEMRSLLAGAGFEEIVLCDEESLYLVTARLPAGTRDPSAAVGPAGHQERHRGLPADAR